MINFDNNIINRVYCDQYLVTQVSDKNLSGSIKTVLGSGTADLRSADISAIDGYGLPSTRDATTITSGGFGFKTNYFASSFRYDVYALPNNIGIWSGGDNFSLIFINWRDENIQGNAGWCGINISLHITSNKVTIVEPKSGTNISSSTYGQILMKDYPISISINNTYEWQRTGYLTFTVSFYVLPTVSVSPTPQQIIKSARIYVGRKFEGDQRLRDVSISVRNEDRGPTEPTYLSFIDHIDCNVSIIKEYSIIW